jgi:hypothetical protein
MRPLIPALLFVLLLTHFSGANAVDGESEALAIVAEHCAARGGEAAECACLGDTFEAEVVSRVSSPRAALLAAYIHTDDQMAMMQAVQATDSQTMQEAGMALGSAQAALEACAADEQPADTKAAALPEGDDPRSRFIRQCAEDNQRPDICACIADKALETLSPQELELMVDMRAAESRGEDPIGAMAEERGLTEEEAREGLAASTGRISGAMMAINPMECVNP